MKKFICVLLIIVSIVTLVGCSKKKQDTSNVNDIVISELNKMGFTKVDEIKSTTYIFQNKAKEQFKLELQELNNKDSITLPNMITGENGNYRIVLKPYIEK